MKILLRPVTGALLLSGALPAAAQDDFQPSEQVIVTAPRLADPLTPATGISAGTAAVTVNAVNTEDMLRYVPDLLVRKRHAGDTQDPPATRTSGIGQSARSLIYADGILISSPIGNNNSAASPHWGLVGPSDIARMDVLFGPFSARYPGGSAGAVINITTAMPDGFETHAQLTGEIQSFAQYGTKDDYSSAQAAFGLGNREGPIAWRLGINHLSSNSQPLAYVTLLRPASPSTAGSVVKGAFGDVNRSGSPIAVIGAGGLEHQDQDTLSGRVTADLSADLHLSYSASLFRQNDDAKAATYLTDAGGAPIWSGAINSGGYAYNVSTSAFSNNVYRWNQAYLGQGASLDWKSQAWTLNASLSRTDYLNDNQRVPSVAMPAAAQGGTGSITRMTGTFWETMDVSASRESDGATLSFGLHHELVSLDLNRFTAVDWAHGGDGSLAAAARGRTATDALWLEQRFDLGLDFKLMLGGRLEQWRAYDGLNFSAAPALNLAQPSRYGRYFSPKAGLLWNSDDRSVSLSYGKAFRMPTVTELYQAVSVGPNLASPNPNLRPERANDWDLSFRRMDSAGSLRFSLFQEEMGDALLSQTAPLNGSTSLVSFVQNIGKIRTRGAELVGDRRIWDDFSVTAGVTYVDSVVLEDAAFPAAIGKRTPQIPRWRLTATATWQATPSLAFTLGARASSRLYASLDNSDTVTHTFQGFDPYLVVDARAYYALDQHWKLGLGADNLGNDRYFLFHPFPQRTLLMEVRYAG
jgi:iron complex outermembrane receptor protein